MVDKQYGKFVMVCDCCDKELPPQDSFDDAVKSASAAGWGYSHEDGLNYCNECKEDMR